MRSRIIPALLASIVVLTVTACQRRPEEFRARAVLATAQTSPVASAEDAADDPAIWIHPTNPSLSLIIGTNKKDGLDLYNVDGSLHQRYSFGMPNNVDVRYGFPLPDRRVDIVATEDRTGNTIRVFAVDAESRTLAELTTGDGIPVGHDVYGSALHHDPTTDQFHFFVGSKTGEVSQFRLSAAADGAVSGQRVRTLRLASQVEGMVADDELGHVYIGEEARGVWKFPVAPDSGTEGILIAPIGFRHPIRRPDVEGLTIYRTSSATGYLIASSQGSNEYVIYTREEPHRFVGTFRIAPGANIGGAGETDGIDVTHRSLGPGYESGAFVAQDGRNRGENQNFKIVPWFHIAGIFEPPLE